MYKYTTKSIKLSGPLHLHKSTKQTETNIPLNQWSHVYVTLYHRDPVGLSLPLKCNLLTGKHSLSNTVLCTAVIQENQHFVNHEVSLLCMIMHACMGQQQRLALTLWNLTTSVLWLLQVSEWVTCLDTTERVGIWTGMKEILHTWLYQH